MSDIRYRLKRYKEKDVTKQPRYRYATKFEIARSIGERALLIDSGAPPLIDIKNETDPIKIAEMELKAEVFPMIFGCEVNNKKMEYWELDEDQHIFKDLHSTD